MKCDKTDKFIVLQSATILLQIATGITKCDDYNKVPSAKAQFLNAIKAGFGSLKLNTFVKCIS